MIATFVWLQAPGAAFAVPVMRLLHGETYTGTSEFVDGLANAWRWDRSISTHRLASEVVEDIQFRLDQVTRGRADFAILPIHAFRKHMEDFPGLRVLGVLWPNYLHALVREDNPAPVFTVPLSKPVVVASNAEYVLNGLREWGRGKGRRLGAIRQETSGKNPISLAVEGDEIVVFSAPAPILELRQAMAENSDLRVMRVSSRISEILELYYPWVQRESLPEGVYAGVGKTVIPAWHMILVVNERVSDVGIQKMLGVLYDTNPILRQANPLFGAIDGKLNTVFAKLFPFHDETARRFGFETFDDPNKSKRR